MSALKIGFGIPRGIGDPRTFPQPDHLRLLRYGQRAAELGFDSVWVPDHFHFERPPGTLTPFPECWTLMTALLATTERVQVGSMVIAAGFRHPAMLAKMAGALQELSGGRLLLGLGAGNQIVEHTEFGFGFDRRVGRFAEYLEILTRLLAGERITFHGRYYDLENATLLMSHPAVPLVIAASGERMIDLTAQCARGWNGGGASEPNGEPFVSKLAQLRAACRKRGRDPSEIEITYSVTVVPTPDAAATHRMIDLLTVLPPPGTPEQIRNRYVVGTPDEVVKQLRRAVAWGAEHLICGIGAQPFTLWSDETLDLFAREVMPRLRESP